MRTTHTVATLIVTQPTYDEIAGKLRAVDYGHVFMQDGTMDMGGIGLNVSPPLVASTVYIASSGDRLADVIELGEWLVTACGMVNAFDWPAHWHHRCGPAVCGLRDRRDLCAKEIEAARTCDLFVGIHRLGKGAHVEFGMALTGRARRFILVGCDPVDLVFYEDPRIEHVAMPSDVATLVRRTATP